MADELRQARPSDQLAPGPHGDQRRGLFGVVLTRTLGPVYYWLDWYGPNRKPDHGKIFGGIAFFWGLVVAQRLWSCARDNQAMMPWFIAFVSLVFVAPYGIRGFAMWFKSKNVGSAIEAGRDALKADIAARRAAVGGDHEVTP